MIPRLYLPLKEPKDIIPHLGKPDLHWKAGFSAQELAFAWAQAGDDLPKPIRDVIQTVPEYVNVELVDGFFERKVKLDTGQAPSQTDLLAVLGLENELSILAVEGKVDESFDEIVSVWNDSESKMNRLKFLCGKLSLYPASIGGLHYQLLHRTASAIIEAHRYRCRHALMLVHSFSSTHRRFEHFSAFSKAMGIPLDKRDQCSAAKMCDGVSLRLAWASDQIRLLDL